MLVFLLLLVLLVPLLKWAGRFFFAVGALLLFLTAVDFLAEHGGGFGVAVMVIIAVIMLFRRAGRR
ncbi:hypothetical protein [Parafrankia discariae]|uniref:hypothetical protein n=1 Tax=Parafrankia discariae TaxID=365528 RepID=UPI0003772889|nr:hypothetical protein [Parafrankia discariae]